MAASRAALASALLALLATIASAPSSLAQYGERVEVTVANVDVVVTDAKGNPVRGLTQADFEIFEDGKLQPISNFSAIDATPGPQSADGVVATGTAAASPIRSPQRRLVVLFVDIAEIDPRLRIRFFDGVRDFCNKVVRDGDFVSVLVWNHRVRISLPPTSEHAALDAALDTLGSPFGASDEAAGEKLASLGYAASAGTAGLAESLGFAPSSDADAELQFRRWLNEEEHCAELQRKQEEMRNVIVSLSRVDMQKLLIYASDDSALLCVHHAGYDAIGDAANAYGVTIHALHPPGVRDTSKGPDRGGVLPGSNAPAPLLAGYGRSLEESAGLLAIARRTGGFAAIGPAQSAKLLQRAARELDVYYSLGYRVPSEGDDAPHGIKVTTKNRAYRVRTRESVVHLSEASRIRDLVTTNLYLPATGTPKGPSFSVKVGEGKRDGRFVILPVELLFDARDLMLVPGAEGKSKGSFTLFVTSGRELGDAAEVSQLGYEFEIPTPPEGDTPANVLYTFGVRVRPDTRRLSIALSDDATGELGARVVPIDPSR